MANMPSPKLVKCKLLLIFPCIAHVEHVGQDHAATEVGEAEEVHQEEEQQQQQFEGEDQEQNQELTNFVDTQGKHRFIYPRVFHKFKFGASPGSFKTQCHYIKFES